MPAGQRVAFHAFAKGVQIYTCQASATDPTQFLWVFKAPEAVLFDAEGDMVGLHYAGPTWESESGSKVVGTVLERSPSPDPNAIPWLLLKATSTEGHGIFARVTYIQRVNTQGGKAPTEGCDAAHVGQEARVPYTAEYFFYRAKNIRGERPRDDDSGEREDKRAPDVPANLKVPAGQKVSFHAFARGVQIYTCQASTTDPTQFLWVFKAPEAVLFDAEGERVGTHYAGPTWESKSGSKVVGAVLERSPSPDPNAIPWLLLKATSTEGHGIFARVTYIQRVNTQGGKAPAEGCDAAHVGQDVRVPYTAEYFFYRETRDRETRD